MLCHILSVNISQSEADIIMNGPIRSKKIPKYCSIDLYKFISNGPVIQNVKLLKYRHELDQKNGKSQ